MLLIGWFFNNAARGGYTQLLVQQAFDELIVGNLMRTHFEVVHPDLTLDAAVMRFAPWPSQKEIHCPSCRETRSSACFAEATSPVGWLFTSWTHSSIDDEP